MKMIRSIGRVAAMTICGVVLAAAPALAELKPGASAPDFGADAARGGAVSHFKLKDALAKGPVVVYFFPKAFTSGCTIEAHAFSEHIADFSKLGATVIGISGDDLETQKKFSTQECRAKFLVASDPGLRIARAYDAVMMGTFASRTSYVIAPDGTVLAAHSDLEPLGHIDAALQALRDRKARS